MDYQEQSMYIKNCFSDKIEIQTSYLSDQAQVESEARFCIIYMRPEREEQ